MTNRGIHTTACGPTTVPTEFKAGSLRVLSGKQLRDKSENSDAGAVKIGNTGYCAVFKIESHNHPTLINPFDGAATGVGGILRDIFAMGAKNVGVGASLRYGPGTGAGSKDVLKGSTEGAASYCGTMGIPLVALDVYKTRFSHNCLMNVSAIGIVKRRSHPQRGSQVRDIISCLHTRPIDAAVEGLFCFSGVRGRKDKDRVWIKPGLEKP